MGERLYTQNVDWPDIWTPKKTEWPTNRQKMTKNWPKVVIIRPPYKIQNPSKPQNAPQNTPQIPFQNRNTEKIRKIYENHPISYIFRIFSAFRFWKGIWGVFRGVFWGSEGVCILYGGRMITSQKLIFCLFFYGAQGAEGIFRESFLFKTQRIAKGAGGKGPRQKTSKIVKKCQKVFRHFSTIFAQGKKRQKSSKNVKKFFDTFRQISRL